jgi:hypothetical protein
MEVVRTSETWVYFNETTLCYIPESCHFHTRRRENLKSQSISLVCPEYIYGFRMSLRINTSKYGLHFISFWFYYTFVYI